MLPITYSGPNLLSPPREERWKKTCMGSGLTGAEGSSYVLHGQFIIRGQALMEQDLHYWTYYPFNFGKPTPLGWLGHRTLNPISLWLS